MQEKSYFIQSFAKINLTLDVLGKREDGYHELATIMQNIDLSDTLCFTSIEDHQIHIVCNQPDLSNNDNLVARAIQCVQQKLDWTQGITVELYKRIPIAAGLAGGSSNAAATLVALRRWHHLPLSDQDLWTIASSLGSDVPFFLTGGLALCEGRGERVAPITPNWPASMNWLLLLKPAIGISTASVFRNLSPTDYTHGEFSQLVQQKIESRTTLTMDDFHNSLERGVLESYPLVAQARQAMLDAGATTVRLSGSGPTLFSAFATLQDATNVQQKLHAQGYELYLTRAIDPDHGTMRLYSAESV